MALQGTMGHAANGGQHGTEELPKISPMVELKQELPAPLVGRLEVLLRWPEMSRCKVWPPFCTLEAYVGGQLVKSLRLPMERGNRKLEQKDINDWRMYLEIPVGWDWPSLSLDLLVARVDYVPWERELELIRGGPHTSHYDAVIGRARVKLLDALILGDDDEDEEAEDRKKRSREQVDGYPPTMEGTLVFDKTVTLHDWVVPAPDREPRPVIRGTVNVLMGMFEPAGSP